MKLLNIKEAMPLIQMAIEEDLGQGDVTSELFAKDNTVTTANIVSREEIVVCGMNIVREILKAYDKKLKLKVHINDGQEAHVGSNLATIRGPLCTMLSAERVLLNFMQRLSGIATATQNTSVPSKAQKPKSMIRGKPPQAGASSKNTPFDVAEGIIIVSAYMTVS